MSRTLASIGKLNLRPLFLFLVCAGLVFGSCAGRDDFGQDEISERYARGISRFESGRWSRAAEDFNWVVLNNPAGNLAAEAQYYYAECLFMQKKYIEAELEYERLLRRWPGTDRYIDARYRIVQSLVAQSPRFELDQQATIEAMLELQEFIDDYPDSEHRNEAEEDIQELRLKIAEKNYEAARQYLKWDQPQSARMYLEIILGQFYDTPYVDDARVSMIVSYLLEEDLAAAQQYLVNEGQNIADATRKAEVERFVNMARQDKFDFKLFRWLYR